MCSWVNVDLPGKWKLFFKEEAGSSTRDVENPSLFLFEGVRSMMLRPFYTVAAITLVVVAAHGSAAHAQNASIVINYPTSTSTITRGSNVTASGYITSTTGTPK